MVLEMANGLTLRCGTEGADQYSDLSEGKERYMAVKSFFGRWRVSGFESQVGLTLKDEVVVRGIHAQTLLGPRCWIQMEDAN